MADADKGLVCGKCGCRHFFVVSTRPALSNKIVRTRECRNCGRRLVTYEAAAGETIPGRIDDLTPDQRDTLLSRLLHLLHVR